MLIKSFFDAVTIVLVVVLSVIIVTLLKLWLGLIPTAILAFIGLVWVCYDNSKRKAKDKIVSITLVNDIEVVEHK